MDKKDFKNKVLAMVRQSLEPSTVLSNIGPCERYSTVDYDRYTGGTMSLEAVRIFEDHCCDCPSCLKGLVQSHERFIREKARSENKVLFQKTMELLDRLEKEESAEKWLPLGEETFQKPREPVSGWVSRLWQPQWAGMPVTSSDIPEQKQHFKMAEGNIEISCHWRPGRPGRSGHISIVWKASLKTPSEFWVHFVDPETEETLARVRLGRHLEGKEFFGRKELGFDPFRRKWAISLRLRQVKK